MGNLLDHDTLPFTLTAMEGYSEQWWLWTSSNVHG